MSPEDANALGVPPAQGDETSPSQRGLNRHGEHFFEELTRANNDLTNLQRELARKNAALTREMAARQQAEASLRLLGSAVEQAMESILITDAEIDLPGPQIVFVNPAFTRMTGYSAEDVIGKTPRILQGPRTHRAVLDRLRNNIQRGEEFGGTTINYRKDGSEFHIEWHLAPLRDAHGKITHFVSVQRDISERVRTESALQKTNAELVDLSRLAGMAEVASGVLHNVGNVLNSVNVSLETVAEKVRRLKADNLVKVAAIVREGAGDPVAFFASPQGGKLPGFLGQLAEHFAGEQAAMLGELDSLRVNVEHINEIVAMQQKHAGSGGVTELLPITDVVEDALRMNASAFERHGAQVVREFDPALPPFAIDRNKLLLILMNLVRNAKYACDDGGTAEKRITVRAGTDGTGCARISVSDTGVGIPAENLTRIFEHGFTTRKSGHGFGLHSSALAVSEMGGSLRAHSDGPGNGATFTIELPLNPTNL